MGFNDPATNMKPLAAFLTRTIATATTLEGDAIDTLGWRWATVIVNVGTVAGTTTGVSAVITSDPEPDGSYATTVATFNEANLLEGSDIDIGRVDCNRTHRYLRIEVTTVGASPSVPIGATVVLSGGKNSADQTAIYSFTSSGPIESTPPAFVDPIPEPEWTDTSLHEDGRYVYVSNDGDDGDDGLSELTPKLTIAAGYALLRDGLPDQLLLRCGDTWEDEYIGNAFGHWQKSGAGTDARMIVTSYGTGARPLVTRTGDGSAFPGTYAHAVSHIALVGIALRGDADESAHHEAGVGWTFEGEDFTVEDCEISNFGKGIAFTFQGDGASDVRIRHNLIHDTLYDGNGTDGHGVYISGAYGGGILIEGNLIARINVSNPNGNRHGIYVHENNHSDVGALDLCTAIDNIVVDTPTAGMHTRTGGTIEGNVVSHVGFGITCGFGADEHVPDGVIVECIGNVILDTRNESGTPNNSLGWGFFMSNIQQGTCSDNLLVRSTGGLKLIATHRCDQGVGVLDLEYTGNIQWIDGGEESPANFPGGSGCAGNVTEPGSTNVWDAFGGDYPDPDRSLTSYAESILGADATRDDLIDYIVEHQRREVWNSALSAPAIVAYVRAGFGLS